jgi:hypothetical protein
MAAVATVLALVTSCAQKSPVQPVASSTSTTTVSSVKTEAERTPFQQSVAKIVAERQLNGVPAPASVSFSYTASPGAPALAPGQHGVQPGQQITIVATTVIAFDHPSQAGNARWPDLVVEGEVPPNARGYIHPGDYSQAVREHLQRQIPDIWSRYEFGYEPRTYTFTEEYRIDTTGLPGDVPQAGTSTSLDEILMGLTIPGPALDYTVRWHWDVLGIRAIDFVGGFALDWGLGIRLPLEAALSSTDPLTEGSTACPTTSIRGLDWTADDFTQAGVAPEDGNEFVMRFEFICGIFLEVAGVSVIDLGVNEQLDESSSFATPFGPGALFELPSIDVKIWDKDVGVAYAKISFQLTPQAGSQKFTAAWLAAGQDPGKASGSGNLLYTAPDVPVPCNTVAALDGPGMASIQMDELRYYFDQFLLDLGLSFYLDVFGVWDGTFTIPITDFDLSALTGNLYVRPHAGTPQAFGTTIFIRNVAPTAEIDDSAAMMLAGTPVFVIHAGDPLGFQARSQDPGMDDLTLSWDWDDGEPSPDVSSLHPVPYDVTDAQTHVFGAARLYAVRFQSMDDDGDSGQDVARVIVTGFDGALARSEGYWQHQCRGNGHVDYDQTQVEGFLGIIDFMSPVFSETRDISSASAAFDVLFLKDNGGSAAQQLDRELLVAWLNFACGAMDLGTMVDLDQNGGADMTFLDAMHHAEVVRLDPAATEKELRRQAQLVHAMQEASTLAVRTGRVVGQP